MRSSILLAFLPAVVSAHFSFNYPANRGDSEITQAESPCGGLNTPSKDRTKWPITGGQLSFEAGHDEANTAVYLALGNNPQAKDFTIILRDRFLQVGLGTFCWNKLAIPSGVNVKSGDNATIQVVQEGHTGGGLYNCADITFTDTVIHTKTCANGTGVTAEGATNHHAGTASKSGSPSSTTDVAASSSTNKPSEADTLKIASGAVIAGVVGIAALLM